MKKVISIVLSLALVIGALFSVVALTTSAASYKVEGSLLPDSVNGFTIQKGGITGTETMTIQANGDGYRFVGDVGGWPNAWYTGSESDWIMTNIHNEDTYLEYDFEVKSGATKVVVYFCGQNPLDMAGAGTFFCVNAYEMPETKKADGDSDIDLGVGQYAAKVPLSELGYREDLLGENGEMLITGMKVFAVGGEVVVNTLAIVSGEQATDPTDPTDPADPTQPTDPTDPTDPTQPTDPTDVSTQTTQTTQTTQSTTTVQTKHSAVVSKSGIRFVLSTDKAVYTKGEDIVVTMELANENPYDVDDLTVKSITPDGYSLGENEWNEGCISRFYEGDTVVHTVRYVANETPGGTSDDVVNGNNVANGNNDFTVDTAKGDSPNTGDASNAVVAIVVVLVAGAAVAMAFVKNNKAQRMMALFLCVAVAASGVAMVPGVSVKAETVDDFFGSVQLTVTVDGAPLLIQASMTNELSGEILWSVDELLQMEEYLMNATEAAANACTALTDNAYTAALTYNTVAFDNLLKAEDIADSNASLPIAGLDMTVQEYLVTMMQDNISLIEDGVDPSTFGYAMQSLSFGEDVLGMTEYILAVLETLAA